MFECLNVRQGAAIGLVDQETQRAALGLRRGRPRAALFRGGQLYAEASARGRGARAAAAAAAAAEEPLMVRRHHNPYLSQ